MKPFKTQDSCNTSLYKDILVVVPEQLCHRYWAYILCFNLKGQDYLYLIVSDKKSDNLKMNTNVGDEEGEKFPRLPYKITQFCELLSLEEHSQLCKTPSMTNSYLFGPLFKFGICYMCFAQRAGK